jgi:hypothetical protein
MQNYIEISTSKIHSQQFQIMRLGLVKGRNLLLKNGFTQCGNPKYYSRRDGKNYEYTHYNHLLKYWIFEDHKWLYGWADKEKGK